MMVDLNDPSGRGRALVIIQGFVFALVGALIVLIALDVIHISIDFQFPRWAAAAFGGIFFLAGVWTVFEGVTSAWGRGSRLYQWTNLLLTIILVLAFTSFFFLFWLEYGASRPDGKWGGIVVVVFCGVFLLFLLVHTIIRVRKLLGKAPDRKPDDGDEP